RGAAARRRRLYPPPRQAASLQEADRDQGDGFHRLLSSRALSPELCHHPSRQPLHRLQRSAQDRQSEDDVPRRLPDRSGPREPRPPARVSASEQLDEPSPPTLAAARAERG